MECILILSDDLQISLVNRWMFDDWVVKSFPDIVHFCSFSHSGGLPDPSTLSVCSFVPSSGLLRPLWWDAVGTGATGPQMWRYKNNYFLNISDFLITLWHFSTCMIHNVLHNPLQAVVWIITSDVPLRYPITAVECEGGAPPMFLWQGGWWTSVVLSLLSHHHPITLMMLYWWGNWSFGRLYTS